MLCSSEVYLARSSYGKVVEASSFEDINVLATRLDIDSRIHRDRVEGNVSRIFKIIDIADTYEHDSLCLLLERRDGLRVICRISDVIFTTLGEHTVTNFSGLGVYEHHIPSELGGMDVKNGLDKFDLAQTLYSMSTCVNTCKFLYNRLVSKELVDKNDSRLTKHLKNRFFLNVNVIELLHYIDEADLSSNRVVHKKCNYCETVIARSKHVYLSDTTEVDVCMDCYNTVEVPCDCCYSGITLSEKVSTRSNTSIHDVFKEHDFYTMCTDCYESAIVSCSRCRCMDMVDVDKLRSSTSKLEVLRKNIHSSKYTHIFSRRYCGTCADSLLNTYLTNPFNYHPLPSRFSGKSEFNRFIGIESEVITESSSADEYSEDREIPNYFDVVNDGSLNEGGVEFVTSRPIIGSQIESALYSLEDVNKSEWNEVDSSCGVHIHMNALDMGFTEIKSLLMIMTRIQYLLYESIPESRRETSYAREITMPIDTISKISNLSQLVDDYYSMADTNISDNKYNDARYIGTNIHARFYLGSIEFRYHEGTIESKPIRDWILFLNKIMSTSKNLHNDNKLYSKILDYKSQPIDIIRDVAGVSGVDYIESKIDTNN
jgi:hypothetical protein